MRDHSPTPDFQSAAAYARLLAGLGRVERRLRAGEMARLGPGAVGAGLVGAVGLAVAGRVWPLGWPVVLGAAVGLVVLGIAGSGAWALGRQRGRLATARAADRVLGLDERVATAVEEQLRIADCGLRIADARATAEAGQEAGRPLGLTADEQAAQADLVGRQLGDAVAALEGALPRLGEAVSRRAGIGLAGLVVALLVVLIAPNPLDAWQAQQAAVQQQAQQEQAKIEALRQEIAARPGDPNDPARAALLQELQDLSQALAAGNLSREEALARLSEAEAQLQQLQDAQAPADKAALEALSRELAQSESKAAQQAGQALDQQKPDAAADALRQLGKDSATMSEAERQALAQTLQQAAQQAAANDPALAQRLADAATALQQSDPAAAQQALDTLADAVGQTEQHVLSQEEIEQALGQVQQSKQNMAQAGTGQAAQGTPGAVSGTAVALNGTPFSGTPVALQGTPGQLALTGTPVLVAGTPGQGTPVIVPGQGQGQAPGQGQGAGVGGTDQAGTGHTDPVEVPPSALNAQGTPVGVAARPNAGGESSTGSTNTTPNSGAVQVPYQDVYGGYADQAQQALGQQYIPAGLKEYVQQYFTSLAPP